MSDNPFEEIDPDGAASRVDRLMGRIVTLENSGDEAISPKGARGMYQITPATARSYGIDYDRLGNPDYARRSARRIVSALAAKYPKDDDVLVAYNAGPGRVGTPIDKLPDETAYYLAHDAALDGKNPFAVLDPGSNAQRPSAARVTPRRPIRTLTRPQPARPTAPPRPHPFADAYNARVQPAMHTLAGDIEGDVRNFAQPDPTGVRGLVRGGKLAIDLLNAGAAPIEGAFDAIAGVPISRATGGRIKPGAVTDVAEIALPFGQELASERGLAAGAKAAQMSIEGFRRLQAAKRAAEAARMAAPAARSLAPTASRSEKVRALEQDGVRLAPWNRKGGEAPFRAGRKMNSPYVGKTYRDEAQLEAESFNRATYNRALRAGGLPADYTGPVGRQGVGNLRQAFGAAYDHLLPGVSAKMDQGLGEDLARISARADRYGPEIRSRVDAIIEQDIRGPMGDREGVMDGETWKRIESGLSFDARGLRGSPDPDKRALGSLIQDVNDALGASAERNSTPGVRARLKTLNKGYAMFTRIEEAAANKAVGGREGVFDTGDLMSAVRRGDHSVRKGAFARGDALMQDWAEAAHSIMRPEGRNPSGTAGALKQGLAGRAIGAAIGASLGPKLGPGGAELGAAAGGILGAPLDAPVAAATNALARLGMERAARRGMSAAGPHVPVNNLKAILARTSPAVQRGVGLGIGPLGLRHLIGGDMGSDTAPVVVGPR